MAHTIKDAAEVSISVISTDGGEVILIASGIVPVGCITVGDVTTQLEEGICVIVTSVYRFSQQIQTLGACDYVGMVFIACGPVLHSPHVNPVGDVVTVTD